MCEKGKHNFEILNEKMATVKMVFGTKRVKVYTLKCKTCGDIGYREVPAGEGE